MTSNQMHRVTLTLPAWIINHISEELHDSLVELGDEMGPTHLRAYIVRAILASIERDRKRKPRRRGSLGLSAD